MVLVALARGTRSLATLVTHNSLASLVASKRSLATLVTHNSLASLVASRSSLATRGLTTSPSLAAKKYSPRHEWVEVDGEEAMVGITTYAAEALGDVVYAELPEQGRLVGSCSYS